MGSSRRSSVSPHAPAPGTGPLVVRGRFGRVTLHPDRVDITRNLMGRLEGNRSSSTLWQDVVAVDFRDPNMFDHGHVHFATATDPRGLTTLGRADPLSAASRNPRAILFTWQQRRAYRRLRELLMAHTATFTDIPVPGPRSVQDELAGLDRLQQAGMLTPAELARAKARLMERESKRGRFS